MKKSLLLIVTLALLAACSSPKYAYYFDHYDYNSGKKNIQRTESQIALMQLATPETTPLHIDEDAVTASIRSRIITAERVSVDVKDMDLDEQRALLERKYSSLTKEEKRAFRKELKSEVKELIKAKKNGEDINVILEKKQMDDDLKMALIFGIIGIVLSALGGVNSVFWILGVIATVVAIVFLIKWIAEQ